MLLVTPTDRGTCGEVAGRPVVDYLRTGLAACVQLPDPVDAALDSIRVVAGS